MPAGVNPTGNLVSRIYSQFTVVDNPLNKVTAKEITAREKRIEKLIKQRAKLEKKLEKTYTKTGRVRKGSVKTNKEYTQTLQAINVELGQEKLELVEATRAMDDYQKMSKKSLYATMAWTAGLITLTKTFTKGISLNIQYIENLNIIERLFGENTDAVLAWSETTRKSFGLAQVSALQYASTLKAFMYSAGVSDNLSSVGAIVGVQLAADLASFRNVSMDTAFRAILSGLAGISRTLRYNFGIDISNDALEERFGTVGSTQAEKIMQRFILLLERSEYAVGDFSRTKNSPANQLRLLNENFKQFAFLISGSLLPMVNMMLRIMNAMLNALISINKVLIIIGGSLAIFNIGRALTSLFTQGFGKFLSIITLGVSSTIGKTFIIALQAWLMSALVGGVLGGRGRVANTIEGEQETTSYLPDLANDYTNFQQTQGMTINIAGNATTESVEEMVMMMKRERFKRG